MAVSFIGGGNWTTRTKPPTCRKSLHLALIGIRTHSISGDSTDCIGSCKSNCHTITATTTPFNLKSSVQCIARYILKLCTGLITGTRIPDLLFPHLAPPAIMVWIFVVERESCNTKCCKIWINGSKIYFQTKIHTIIAGGTK